MGFVQPKLVQDKGIDSELQTALWNVLSAFHATMSRDSGRHVPGHVRFQQSVRRIWTEFFKFTSDTVLDGSQVWPHARKWFLDNGRPWHELYSFIEFLAQEPEFAAFVSELNEGLQKENSGFRFQSGHFVPITSPAELAAVEQALSPTETALSPVAIHLRQALALLADREKPDYRNSMKESICAVECLCKLIAGMPAATLGPALDKVAKDLSLHDAQRDGFKKLYGYTSDADGIRHALKNDDEPEQEDARYLLVACSAFVNYIIEKARKAGKLPA
jgi:hypothetical protein